MRTHTCKDVHTLYVSGHTIHNTSRVDVMRSHTGIHTQYTHALELHSSTQLLQHLHTLTARSTQNTCTNTPPHTLTHTSHRNIEMQTHTHTQDFPVSSCCLQMLQSVLSHPGTASWMCQKQRQHVKEQIISFHRCVELKPLFNSHCYNSCLWIFFSVQYS